MHTPLLFLTLPVVATLLGGFFALRFEHLRPLLVAVGTGLLLGAAFLDLLPEALALGLKGGLSAEQVLGLTLLFFLSFSALEIALDGAFRAKSLHPHPPDMSSRQPSLSSRQQLGRLAGGLLIFHSFRDAMAIGAAFAASHIAGYAVATGIVAHDFGDGMNTVILTTAGERPRRGDYLFLAADALAPFLGGLLTVWWLLTSRSAAVLLALAAGFFLQMATGDFLPPLRAGAGTQRWLIGAVMGGAAIIYGSNRLLHRL